MSDKPEFKIYCGDALETTKTLEDHSVDCVITSPPYWQLRDYGFPDQWGLEPTFQEYLEKLWTLMDEVWRVLKPTGTAWINLGDTYASDSKWGGSTGGKHQKALHGRGQNKTSTGIKDKCLLLIPHRFAIGCIDRGWIVRNDIVWGKRNATPEPVTDRFSKKHEYFFLMAKGPGYFFDLDAVRDKCKPLNRWGGPVLKAKNVSKWDAGTGQQTYRDRDMQPNNAMKNPGDVADFWDIPTQQTSADHYATFNTDLIDKPIKAGCPVGGTILDMFCGTGTTGFQAVLLKRNFIGIDGDKYSCEFAKASISRALGKAVDIPQRIISEKPTPLFD